MAEFKFVKADGSVLDYSTGYVVVEKMVPTKVRVPLFDANGVRLSVEDLAEKAGLKLKYIPHQTAEYLAFAKIQFMYGAVPEFAGVTVSRYVPPFMITLSPALARLAAS